MTLDNKINTKVNLSSEYLNNSINDSVFLNSSISVDVIQAWKYWAPEILAENLLPIAVC